VFTVTLPFDAKPPALPSGASNRASGTDGSGSTGQPLRGVGVIVVEDEQDSRELYSVFLASRGAEVRAAASCAEAWALFESKPPDLLISDIEMPGENGYDLISKVRSLPVDRGGAVPAIALTAHAGVENASDAIRSGFQLHVSKPVELGELVGLMRELVGPS
jgi:CheY-like chemotaxis protein